tara:strand:- start:275 stop:478 length:204 start_codon:yes stop_codon:yes gene_type:complete
MDFGKDGMLISMKGVLVCFNVHYCTRAIATRLSGGRIQTIMTRTVLTINTITTIFGRFATFKACYFI